MGAICPHRGALRCDVQRGALRISLAYWHSHSAISCRRGDSLQLPMLLLAPPRRPQYLQERAGPGRELSVPDGGRKTGCPVGPGRRHVPLQAGAAGLRLKRAGRFHDTYYINGILCFIYIYIYMYIYIYIYWSWYAAIIQLVWVMLAWVTRTRMRIWVTRMRGWGLGCWYERLTCWYG